MQVTLPLNDLLHFLLHTHPPALVPKYGRQERKEAKEKGTTVENPFPR
jgi:hypothetical protein